MMQMGCRKEENSTFCPFGQDQQGRIVGVNFTKEQWEGVEKTPWPGTAMSFYGLSTRLFGRTDSNGPQIYMSALACGNEFFQGGANAGSPVLYAFSERLFFKDPNLKHVKLIYDDGWNVIYEVNWEGIPDPQNYTEWTKQRYVLPPLT
jgi:hypothetical protein